jgi:hypothetical protein
MAVIPLAISAAGAAASGIAASNAADYQAQVAKQNAAFAAQKAQMGMQDAATKLAEKGLQDKATMGKMEAGQASSGLTVKAGSTGDVLESERAITKTGSRDFMKAASLDWYATKKQQYSAQAESALQEAKSETALYAGAAEAGSSFLGGMSKMNKEYGWFS